MSDALEFTPASPFVARDAIGARPGDVGTSVLAHWSTAPDHAGILSHRDGTGETHTVFLAFALSTLQDSVAAIHLAANALDYLLDTTREATAMGGATGLPITTDVRQNYPNPFNPTTTAFKNKKLIVRHMNHWPDYEMGLYWDSFSHLGQQGQWNTHRSILDQGRYLTQVVEGEVAYGWGTNVAIPRFGADPDETLTNPQYTDNIIDTIRELHASALGWVASYNPNDPTIRTNAARMQKEFGYGFHLTEFACSARTERGDNLDVRFKVKNKASAPFDENWPLAVVLILVISDENK